MILAYKDSTISVEISTESVDKGTSFVKERKKIKWKKIDTDKKYRKMKVNTVKFSIPFDKFNNICRLWNNQFNNYASFEERKTILDLMSLSGLVNTNIKNPYDISSIENELKGQYNTLSKNPIEIEITIPKGDYLYHCDYYLIFKPTSALFVDIELVPVDKFNNADKDKIDGYFFFAIKILFSRLQDGIDSTSDKDKPTVLTLDTFQLPMATKTITYSDYVLVNTTAHFLTSKITPQGVSPKAVFSAYEDLSKFVTAKPKSSKSGSANSNQKKDKDKDKKEYYFYKEWGSKSVMCLTEISSKKKAYQGEGYFAKLKKTFIYPGVFFPIYLELKTNSFLSFYACEDSEKRSRFGFFSNDYLGDNLQQDKALFDDFNAFFVYDFLPDLANPIISKTDLDIPDFSDS